MFSQEKGICHHPYVRMVRQVTFWRLQKRIMVQMDSVYFFVSFLAYGYFNLHLLLFSILAELLI